MAPANQLNTQMGTSQTALHQTQTHLSFKHRPSHRPHFKQPLPAKPLFDKSKLTYYRDNQEKYIEPVVIGGKEINTELYFSDKPAEIDKILKQAKKTFFVQEKASQIVSGNTKPKANQPSQIHHEKINVDRHSQEAAAIIASRIYNPKVPKFPHEKINVGGCTIDPFMSFLDVWERPRTT